MNKDIILGFFLFIFGLFCLTPLLMAILLDMGDEDWRLWFFVCLLVAVGFLSMFIGKKIITKEDNNES